MLTDENPELAELRAIAEKATHGPWRQDSDGDGVVYCDEDECFAVGYGMEPKNAAFIGAANPTTVIALLDGIRDLQKRLYDALINAPMPVLKLDDEQVRLFEANRELATLRARNAQLEEAERLFIIRAHAIEGDHCEDDVVRAIVERLQSSVVGAVWQRDAARATVERVREVATKHRGIVEGAKRSAISSAWRPLDCAVSDIEAALTPPGDGGSR